jgi:hypothetical protein
MFMKTDHWLISSACQLNKLILILVVNCGFPGYLANGFVLGQSYLFGDVVSYDCRQGFKLVGGDRNQGQYSPNFIFFKIYK